MWQWQGYFAVLFENKNYYWLRVEMLNTEPIISIIDSILISIKVLYQALMGSLQGLCWSNWSTAQRTTAVGAEI